jgi:hypothetical protein
MVARRLGLLGSAALGVLAIVWILRQREHTSVQLVPAVEAGTPAATVKGAPAAKAPAARKAPPVFINVGPVRESRKVVILDPAQARALQQLVTGAVSDAAHGPDTTKEQRRATGQCIREFGLRRPDAVTEGTRVEGAFTATVVVEKEQARTIKLQGGGTEDETMLRCLEERTHWLSGKPFAAPGAPDGETTVEWPYSISLRGPPPGL